MASEIAKLLNSSKFDTEKLNSLLHEYLLTNEDDGCNCSSDDEDIQFYDSESDGEEINIDLRTRLFVIRIRNSQTPDFYRSKVAGTSSFTGA